MQKQELADFVRNHPYFQKRFIKKGFLIFAGISILSMAGIYFYAHTGKTLEILISISWYYIPVSFAIVAIDLVLGGWRNHIFARHFIQDIPQSVCFKANLANIFMAAVTPSQSGGGPAQWYVLYRNGLSLTEVVGISFYNWISTIILFPVMGLLAMIQLKDKAPEGIVLYLTQFGFSIFSSLFVVLMVGLFAPGAFRMVLRLLVYLAGSLGTTWKGRIAEKGNVLLGKVLEYRGKYLGLMVRKPQLMGLSFLLTIALYFNKFLLGYLITVAFGVETDFRTILAIQAILYLLMYFAPSPGGSGIAEISITALMIGVLGKDYIASFTLLYRGLLVYFPAMLGAVIFSRQIMKE